MKQAHDIYFIPNTGDYKGQKYGFMLSQSNRIKSWTVNRLYKSAPSMIKERIEFGIAVRDKNVASSSAIELSIASKIIDQLEEITKAGDTDLVGLDGIQRKVRIDRTGFQTRPVTNEVGRNPEYEVHVICWSLYE